jgi:hypothetical protein
MNDKQQAQICSEGNRTYFLSIGDRTICVDVSAFYFLSTSDLLKALLASLSHFL